jgi:hypothetical protein
MLRPRALSVEHGNVADGSWLRGVGHLRELALEAGLGDDFIESLADNGLPHLERLAIRFDDQQAARFAAAVRLPSLVELHANVLGIDGARALVAAPGLAGVRVLGLTVRKFLDQDRVAELRRDPRVRLT